MSSKIAEATSAHSSAAARGPGKGAPALPGTSQPTLVTTVLAVALGVMVADRVLMELSPAWSQQENYALGKAGDNNPLSGDAPGERWPQQSNSAVVYVMCLVFGYLSFMALRGPPRKTKAAEVVRQPPRAGQKEPWNTCSTGFVSETAARLRGRTPTSPSVDVDQDGQLPQSSGSRVGLPLSSPADAASFLNLIRAYARKGDLEAAWGCLKRMIEAGHSPNEQTCSLFVNAAVKAEDIAAAEAWMQRMSDAGVEPTALLYMMMINGCTRLSSVPCAERWLRRMTDAGFTPDIACFNSLIHACSSQCDVDTAERWFQEMVEHGIAPTVMTFTSLLDACARALDVKRAEKWLEAMIEQGISPNVVSFSSMINACAKVGDLARAEHWHDHMQEQGVQPNAYCYSALINACSRVGNVESACLWLQRAEKTGAAMDGVIYGCVINACGKVGDAERAMSVFRQMKAQGIQSHIVVYAALARPFAYQGDWMEVERIRKEMEGEGIVVNDYFLYAQILAYGRAKPRQSDRAEAVFCDAVASGLRPNEQVFKALGTAVGRSRCCQLSGLSREEATLLAKTPPPWWVQSQ